MRTTFLFISLLACLVASCTQPNVNEVKYSKLKDFYNNENDVFQKNGLVAFQPADPELDEVLAYTGIDPIGQFDIQLNTNNAYYSNFIAVYTCPPADEEGKTHSSSDVQLVDYKFYNGCFLYPLVKDEQDESKFAKKNFKLDFAIDKKINKILHNDSIYFCLNKGQFETFPVEGSLSSYSINPETNIFSQDEPMPMFVMNINRKNEEPNHMSMAMLGFVSYDCHSKYDWDAVFESDILKIKSLSRDLTKKEIGSLNLNNYKINE